MTMKVFGVSLILSYLFLCVMGKTNDNNNNNNDYMEVTEEDYSKFQGIDPLTTCGNSKAMIDMCMALGKPEGAEDFYKGYPDCESYDMELKTKCGGKVIKKTKFLICGWNKGEGCVYCVYGKGKTPGRVMSYVKDSCFVHHAYGECTPMKCDD